MYTIKYFKYLLEQVTYKDEFRRFKRAEKLGNTHRAQFMSDYCRYLEKLLSSYQIVVIRINIYAEYRTLHVDYLTGESNVLLDSWKSTVLLPAVEQIVAKDNRQIVYNYVSEQIVA